MSDTTFFSSDASFTESEISVGVSAVASPQKSLNSMGPQSSVPSVDSENAELEVSFVDDDDDDEEEEEESSEESAVETDQPYQAKPSKGSTKANSTMVSESSMEEDDRVYVKVLADNETTLRFQIKSTTKMARLMGAYSWKTGLGIDQFRFYYQGKMVDENDTVRSLALPWGSVIDAHIDLEGWDDSYKQFLDTLKYHDN
ncbi:hypothetical protein KR074_000336 [Drosophila pseudoananassae]|nr:hypothetical protein KR074_000336 [Drosophila pseudoananassae]